jgi:hypothetical protein
MAFFTDVLRVHGYDDLAELWQPGFDKFSYVAELQRALELNLHRIGTINQLHYQATELDRPQCGQCGWDWPCPTREALEGKP